MNLRYLNRNRQKDRTLFIPASSGYLKQKSSYRDSGSNPVDNDISPKSYMKL